MRILVATDLSTQSDEALRQTNALAQKDDLVAAIHVVPAFQPMRMLFPHHRAQDALDAGKLTTKITDLVTEGVHRAAADVADIFVDHGVAYAEIVRRAETWKADVIVVGNTGQSGVAPGLGGVAERVLRHASCRVLVTRQCKPSGRVLAATDLSEPSLPAVAAGVDEARRRRGTLHVVHAVDFLKMEAFYLAALGTPATYDPSSLRDPVGEHLASALGEVGVRAESKIIDGFPSAAILREAEAIGAELIVVGAHGRSSLKRFLLGSVAEKVAREATCSVLVVRIGA